MIVAVLQARTGSTRLPGKVLAPVLGRPMLERQIERVRRARGIDRLVVATSTGADDDALAELCAGLGVACHRGPLDDVLERVAGAAADHGAEHVVRLTGDCPLADPAVIDRTVALHREGGFDYTSNVLERRWPDGLDVEVVRRAALEEARHEARLPSEREHVTPFLYARPQRYRLGSLRGERDLSRLRWVVDEDDDLAFVRAVYERLYPGRPDFDSADVLALLEREPELAARNAHVDGGRGWRRSLERDARMRGARP